MKNQETSSKCSTEVNKLTSASDRANAISGATPPSRPIAILLQKEHECDTEIYR